jgi:hypothetical protein
MTWKSCGVCGMNIFESMEISVNEKYFHYACFMQISEQIKKEITHRRSNMSDAMIEGKK